MNIRYFFLFLILAFCGCFESKEPLCSFSESYFDNRVLGSWERINDKGTLNITNNQSNMLNIMVSKHGLGTPEHKDNYEFRAFICKSESNYYVNLITESSMKELTANWHNKGKEVYSFFKYHLTDNGELKVYQPTYRTLRQATVKNQVKGKAWKTTWGSNVVYEDSSERIIAWFNKQEDLKAFEEYAIYKKIT